MTAIDEQMARAFIAGLQEKGLVVDDPDRVEAAIRELVAWSTRMRRHGLAPERFMWDDER